MIHFGYNISTDRQIDLDRNDRSLLRELTHDEPSFAICIQCGTCSATCSAANFTNFSPRYIFLKVKRGIPHNLHLETAQCMLCGKCFLACPRGVNTRNVMLHLKDKL